MSDPFTPEGENVTRVGRIANRLAALGRAGAATAGMLLWLEQRLSHHSFNTAAPASVLACTVATWQFGGGFGLLLVLQWLAHELAHLYVAQQLALKPGWRVMIPFIGAQVATRGKDFLRREDEALVALAGILVGLILATALLGYGEMLGSDAMIRAAKFGFAFNLVSLLPFRPFDGGRIFPGYLWHYASDGGDIASRRFVDGCRRLVGYVRSERPGRPQETRGILADATNILLFGALFLLAATWLILPPMVFALALLATFAGLWAFIAALLQLDPHIVLQPAAHTLQPRRPMAPIAAASDLPWQGRHTALASLGIYVVAVSACIAGTMAA